MEKTRNKERNDKLIAAANEIAAALGNGWTAPDPRLDPKRYSEDEGDFNPVNYLTFSHPSGGEFGGWIDTYANRHSINDGKLGKAEFRLEWPTHRTYRIKKRNGYDELPAWKTVIENRGSSGYKPAWWARSEHGDNLTAGVSLERPAAAIAKDLKRRLSLDDYPGWYAEAMTLVKKRIGADDAEANKRLRLAKLLDGKKKFDWNHERPLTASGSAGPAAVEIGDSHYTSDVISFSLSKPTEAEAKKVIRFLKTLRKPAEDPAPAFETLELFAA